MCVGGGEEEGGLKRTLTSLSDASAWRPSAMVMRLPLESYSPPAIPRLIENDPPKRREEGERERVLG